MKTVKVGAKQRHLKIPEGWELVTTGEAKEGDRFANVQAPKPYWVVTDEDDWGDLATDFDALIRKIGGRHVPD